MLAASTLGLFACADDAARRPRVGAPPGPAPAPAGPAARAATRPMRILILGGTGFLGPALVRDARARGHKLTLFNRGKTNPHLFPDLEQLHGDRKVDLSALRGRAWDAVIDTSGYVPAVVRRSAEQLRDGVGHYVFISTISVYDKPPPGGVDEAGAVGRLADETIEKVSGETYGPLKALCEREAERAFAGRATAIRPGLIVGPDDPTDRFTYWPVRLDRGGEMLAPGAPANDRIQFIDVRDLAAWTVAAVERRHVGVYNAVGPREPLTAGAFLEAGRKALGSNATPTWVPASFLEKHKVEPWSDMPVWVPSGGEDGGMARVDSRRAIERGLAFRPAGETFRDTLAWWKAEPAERRATLRAGLSPEREAEVLALWRAETKR
jgi:2'-hydroxyisoflavone reductase